MTSLASTPFPRRSLLATSLATLLAGLAASACAAPGPVVISQVYGAGGNAGAAWNRDFIELFNRSGAPVSLGGKSVQYQSATGTSWNSTALPAVTLQPGQYFLVTGAGGANGSEVGAADQTGTLNLSATTGKVALAGIATSMTTAEGEAVIDMVGFGTANRFETAVAPAPSNTNAIHRAGLGCVDTDNNALDFSAGPVAGPRRAASPPNSCGGPVVLPIVASCPAGIQTEQGSAGRADMSAIDGDSIVDKATIVAGGVPGIGLSNFIGAAAVGGRAEASLEVGAGLAAGKYPVRIEFGNNDGQVASCTVNVSVAGALTIPRIQGPNPASAYHGAVMATEGVITAKVGSGFFIQDPDGDGDVTTSDAIFVFGAATDAVVGDRVRVVGTVDEYRPSGATRTYTELKDVTSVSKISGGHRIAPTNIGLPDDLARYEGMLVRFTTPLTVNQNKYLGERGELTLAYGRRENPTNRYPAGSPEAAALAQQNAANEVVLDDGIFTTPPTIPFLAADGTVRAGDTVSDLTGVLDFGAIGGGGAAFKLQPTETPVFSRTNERSAPPPLAAGNVKVASANVLNFFTTFTDGRDAWGRSGQGCTIGNRTSAAECRGADNTEEFIRQRDKIVASLKALDADVVGLMEIQNNDDIAAGYLVEQLNKAIGAPAYAVVPKPAATGTDAIRVAMIYKPAAVKLVGGALSDGDAVNNRPPMAQTFKANNGARFSVIVNHLKSKASCGGAGAGDTDPGNGQGCWDLARTNQAKRLATYFVPQVTAAAGDPDVLVIGDLNAYAFENPINYLTGAGFVNQIERYVRPHGMPYSYVFDGQSGYLDHALASSSLHPQVAGAAEWHNNADEPETIDYNLGDTPTDPFVTNAYRASDHDPVVISLNLTPTFLDATGSVKLTVGGFSINRLTGKYTGSVTIANTSGKPLSGPLHLVLQGLPGGVSLDNRSGEQGGAPYLTLPQAAIAAGASVTVSTTFSNPSKTSIVYTPKLMSGTF
ncbi:ExeM/NucH family extracellular endonuclease [Massilia niastensis]|uniref:ExeM/NucH family extracellular endonuclease n=1 Tax=Massilia niastensis TaxID=544911 RepID=UPI0003A4B9B5|nr:ExeM/NucH family extracellular endonuclease [Massilia niastensis]